MIEPTDKMKLAGTHWDATRAEMVAQQLRQRGIQSKRILAAMAVVPRHLFVSPELAGNAYSDSPLLIGEGQTISQPYMVAAATEALSLEGNESALEIGAGCGYQAAVLSLLVREVTAVESQPKLAAEARARLQRLGYANVRVLEGDGSAGWPAHAPYHTILVSAAAPRIPGPLIDQLADGGRLVIPVGDRETQELVRVTRTETGFKSETICNCRFVPLLGDYGWSEPTATRKPPSGSANLN
jgi:protein-L-isoaspartate(D-aspartate) O-methyltransferase